MSTPSFRALHPSLTTHIPCFLFSSSLTGRWPTYIMFPKTLFTACLFGAFVASVPEAHALAIDRRAVAGPVIDQDFPDPGILRNGADGLWYAYSTSSGGKNIPVAKSTDFNSWTIVGKPEPSDRCSTLNTNGMGVVRCR